jgi:O-antigen ligase
VVTIKDNKNIIIIGVTMVFLNLTTYFSHLHLFPFPGYIVDVFLFLMLVFFYAKKRLTFPTGNIILFWILYFIILNIIYFMFSSTGLEEFAHFKLALFSLFIMFSLILLFNLDDDNLTITRRTMIPLGVIAAITLGIDYFDPGYFYFGRAHEFSPAGRATSVYINANVAGGVMVLFLIFGIDMVPRRFRILFIMTIFLGLFFTMSRSNIMIMLLTLTIMFFQGKLHGRQLFITFASIIVFFTWLSTGGLDTLSEKFDIKITDNMRSRVDFFADKKHSDTSDMNERKHILKAALEMFMDKPVFGNGFASTRLWHFPVSPHNTFVMHWADYGIFGMLIIPMMLFFASYYIFKYARREHRQLALLIILYFTLSSFFSHNMLDQPLQLAVIMALSVIGYKAKLNYLRGNINDK